MKYYDEANFKDQAWLQFYDHEDELRSIDHFSLCVRCDCDQGYPSQGIKT